MRGTPRCSICPRGYSTASNAGGVHSHLRIASFGTEVRYVSENGLPAAEGSQFDSGTPAFELSNTSPERAARATFARRGRLNETSQAKNVGFGSKRDCRTPLQRNAA
jgi:hypothetical protein